MLIQILQDAWSSDSVALRRRILAWPFEMWRATRTESGRLAQWELKLLRHFIPFYFLSHHAPQWKLSLRRKLDRERPPPDFVGIGAVRSGTTTLANLIFQHPAVVLPLAKEINAKLPLDVARLYLPSSRAITRARTRHDVVKTGYVTPLMNDLTWPHVFKDHFPHARLLIILRNPVDRTFSHWNWDRFVDPWRFEAGWKCLPGFAETVNKEIESLSQSGVGFRTISGDSVGYVSQSVYYPVVKEYLETLGRERILVIKAEDLFEDRVVVMRRVFEFLALPARETEPSETNTVRKVEKLEVETRARLVDFFRPHNARLGELLNRDMNWDK